MMTRLLAFAWICLCTFAAQAETQRLPFPTVAYAADRIMESDAGTFTGKVYSSFGLERTEMNAGGMQSVMILRSDKDLGWMLLPAQRMYQTLDFTKAREQSGASPASDVTITQVGEEAVEGVSATKYKLVMKDGSAGGFMWFSQEGIALKMDLLSKEDGRKSRMTMTLKNLVVGDQDPSLFELPPGYNAMPAMGGFGMPSAAAAGAMSAPAPANDSANPDAGTQPQQPAETPALTPGSVIREAARQAIFKLPGLRNR